MISVVLAALGACSTFRDGPTAVADLEPIKGNMVWGKVSFVQVAGKVTVNADVRGLRPGAQFGFHVHEKGDCGSPDGMAAGGHFNPTAKPHAHYDVGDRHAGDLMSLKSDGEGVAVYSFETNLLSVTAGPTSVVGRAIVIDAEPDDYRTQPTGNSGARIACGLIRAV